MDVTRLLSLLCPLIYFGSYLTRKDYPIVMDAIISREMISESMAGLVETLGVISYGIGQVISGILGDRFKPQRLITLGLGVTVLCNISMPFTPAGLRGALWFINGFAQSMLWPPLVRIMSAVMDEKRYNTVSANVNAAGISGTIFIYITSSLIWLKYFDSWKLTFFTSAFLTALILVFWIVSFKKIEKTSGIHFERKKEEKKAESSGKRLSFKLILSSGFVFIALAIVAQGALRDGITDWVPTLLRNTFSIPTSYAILYSVIIPIIGVISMKVVGVVANRWVKEELSGSAAVFACAAVLCTALFLLYTKNQYVTVAVAAVIVGAMWAINFFLVCVVPTRFEKYGIVSTMSGIINSLTYVGTSLAVTGFPALTKDGDWGKCIFVWIFIAAFGAAVCIAGKRAWKRFKSA